MEDSAPIKVHLVPLLYVKFHRNWAAVVQLCQGIVICRFEEPIHLTHSQELLNVLKVRRTNVVVDSMNDANSLSFICLASKQTDLLLLSWT